MAAVLLWLTTGKLAQGDTAAAIRRRASGWDTDAPPWTRAVQTLDTDLRSIVARSLDEDPKVRHVCAEAFANDLERWLAHEPILWRRTGWTRRAMLLVKRQPAAGVVGAAGLLLVLVVVAAFGYRIGDKERQRLAAVAETNRALASADRDRVSNMRTAMESALAAMGETMRSRQEWFPMLSVLESMTGPMIFDVTKVAGWAARIDATRDFLRVAHANGREREPDVVMWEAGLGYWLLRAGRAEEALPVFEHNLKCLGDSTPQTTWKTLIQALRDTAELRVLRESVAPPDAGTVARLRAKLAQARRDLATVSYSTTMRAEIDKELERP